VAEFLKGQPDVLKRIQAQAKAPLKDAAAVNASRWVLVNRLKAWLPVTTGSGGRTKFNRTRQGFEKDHWIDAVCVAESGERVSIRDGMKPLVITAKGRGTHQVGAHRPVSAFHAGKPGASSELLDFQPGTS
jgi:hypothetical protein